MSIFYLKSTSPAIDAGTSAIYSKQDIIGTTRPKGAGVDCGAYEWDASVIIGTDDLPEPASNFKAFPNPASDIVTIKGKAGTIINKIELFSLTGRLELISKDFNNNEAIISISALGKGVYIMKISYMDRYEILKIIKQ